MPISKEKQKLYPDNWKEISYQVRYNAKFQCEICDALGKEPHPVTGAKVILTVHHLDFAPQNNEPYNLIALCQRCHNRIDKRFRAKNRKLRKELPFEKENS